MPALLRRLGGKPANTSSPARPKRAATLASLGADGLNEERFAAWRSAHVPKPNVRLAAQSWTEAGRHHRDPAPAHALFAAAGLSARAGVTRAFSSFRAAYPAAGFGDRDHLSTLRSDAIWSDRPVTWRRRRW
jgi:hypothetical protein